MIKQLTEIKTRVNPTNTFTSSTDKTTQNSDNVIDKNVQNNNKDFLNTKK